MSITCADADVLCGRVSMPGHGVLTAFLELDRNTVPKGAVTIAAEGGLQISGYVVDALSAVESEVAKIAVVGGAGGLGAPVAGFFRNAKFRDVLGAVTTASTETLDDEVASDLLDLDFAFYTLGRRRAAAILFELVAFADQARNKVHHWRFTPAGKLWIGEETWPAAQLPADAQVIERFPNERRVEIAAETLTAQPGFDLAGVGKVGGVDHLIQPNSVRTWAWMA